MTALVKIVKTIWPIMVLIGAFLTAVYFLEDRQAAKAELVETRMLTRVSENESRMSKDLEVFKLAMEKDSVDTFQKQQEYYDTRQKREEQEYDRNRLNDLKDHKVMLQQQLSQDPNNMLLQDRLQNAINSIERLENKLFN